MKRLLLLVFVFLLATGTVAAQQASSAYTFTAQTPGPWIPLKGSGVAFHQISWYPDSAGVTGCVVALQYSNDGSTSAGTIVSGQTCTSTGGSALSASTYANWVRINPTTKTGTGTVTVRYAGFTTSPVALSSVTVTDLPEPVSVDASATPASGPQAKLDSTSVTPATNTLFGVTPDYTYPDPFVDLAVPTLLTTTSGTVATAVTVKVITLICDNNAATSAQLNITNTAATPILGIPAAFVMPTKSILHLTFPSGLLAVGVKWWSDTASAISCSLSGVK